MIVLTLVSSFRMESGEDVPPPEVDQALVKMAQVLNQMQLSQDRINGGNARVTIQEFLQLNPRTFDVTAEPIDADDWLREMNKTISVAHVADEDRVPYVTYLLRGVSAAWSDNYLLMAAPGRVVTPQLLQPCLVVHSAKIRGNKNFF